MTPRRREVDPNKYREGAPVPADEPGHAPGCTVLPVYKVENDELVVGICQCVEGCEHRERAIQRGNELAKEHGW